MDQDFTNVYRNLMSVGLLGVVYRTMDDANEICDIVESTLAQPMQFRVCRAVVSGMAGYGSIARNSLGSYVEQNPDDEAAKLALAISLLLAGDADGKQAIESLLVTSSDVTLRQTAHSMLELLEREPALLS